VVYGLVTHREAKHPVITQTHMSLASNAVEMLFLSCSVVLCSIARTTRSARRSIASKLARSVAAYMRMARPDQLVTKRTGTWLETTHRIGVGSVKRDSRVVSEHQLRVGDVEQVQLVVAVLSPQLDERYDRER
jgi:hypothetical protein